MCGAINLRLVAADKWHSFKNIFNKDSSIKHQDYDFLNELYIPKNMELGRFVSNVYNVKHEDPAYATTSHRASSMEKVHV